MIIFLFVCLWAIIALMFLYECFGGAPLVETQTPCTCAGGTQDGKPDPNCLMCGGDGWIALEGES